MGCRFTVDWNVVAVALVGVNVVVVGGGGVGGVGRRRQSEPIFPIAPLQLVFGTDRRHVDRPIRGKEGGE